MLVIIALDISIDWLVLRSKWANLICHCVSLFRGIKCLFEHSLIHISTYIVGYISQCSHFSLLFTWAYYGYDIVNKWTSLLLFPRIRKGRTIFTIVKLLHCDTCYMLYSSLCASATNCVLVDHYLQGQWYLVCEVD